MQFEPVLNHADDRSTTFTSHITTRLLASSHFESGISYRIEIREEYLSGDWISTVPCFGLQAFDKVKQ
jgi:hypothetical protein